MVMSQVADEPGPPDPKSAPSIGMADEMLLKKESRAVEDSRGWIVLGVVFCGPFYANGLRQVSTSRQDQGSNSPTMQYPG